MMNVRQKAVLLVFVAVAVAMMLFPPFQIVLRGTEINMGYGFLFDPPKRGYVIASVNVSVLLMQWLCTGLVAAAAWLLVRDGGQLLQNDRSLRDPKKKTAVEKIVFLSLRLCRIAIGLVCGWQVVGLVPVLTWLGDPAAVTGGMVAAVLVKAAVMIACGFLFFGLGKTIHCLHRRWYGRPHPALRKVMAL